MAKDRYTEERDRQEEAKKRNAEKKEERVDPTIEDPVVGDDTPVIGLDPDTEILEHLLSKDDDIYYDGSNDSVVSEDIIDSFVDYGSISPSGMKDEL